eukprot:GFYU01002896.1.p1 GENE.GFYU01002896.1~~GFYU01002896.1.p1  ORF type:complete len:303 (+),score=64.71 GFYU01002896.1:304-1212(+)
MTAPNIVLWHCDLSFYSSIARLALEEKELEYTQRHLDIHKGLEHLTADFANISPNMTVPVMKITPCGKQGELVSGVLNICKSLDKHATTPPLMPTEAEGDKLQYAENALTYLLSYPAEDLTISSRIQNPVTRSVFAYQVRRKVNKATQIRNSNLDNKVQAGTTRYIEHQEDVLKRCQLPATLEKAMEDTKRMLTWMEERLQEHKWIAGQFYTLADVLCTAVLANVIVNGFQAEIEMRPMVRHYWSQVQERPSFQKAQMPTALGARQIWNSYIKKDAPKIAAGVAVIAAVVGIATIAVLKLKR